MIGTTSISRFLQRFCENSENIEKFKIFVRLNFSIDLYAIVNNDYNVQQFHKDFELFANTETSDLILDFDLRKWKIKINLCKASEAFEDSLFQDLFDGEYNNIEQGPRLRLNSLIDKNVDLHFQRKTPIITFYSYKGGMGRTTTLMSYAIDLALNRNKRVAIIDCDLEAPGYLNFFNLSQHKSLASGRVNGLVEFLSDLQFSKDSNHLDLNNYIVNVSFGNEGLDSNGLENIYLMPAGNLNEDFDFGSGENRWQYIDGLSRINLSNVNSLVKSMQVVIDKINDEIHPDIILIDSRTGFNDIIGTSTLYLADMIVGFFGFNEQTVPGLLNLIDSYYHNDFKLLLVSSILPQQNSDELLTEEVRRINRYIDIKYGSEGIYNKDIPQLLPLKRVPQLETIGSSKSQFAEYVSLVRNKSIVDYVSIFDALSCTIFPANSTTSNSANEAKPQISSSQPSIQLRNIVLKALKDKLSSIKSFAEITEVNEELFFYRSCMNELFEENKFLICGYKGTGKTYLYKALSDPSQDSIARKILLKANVERKSRRLPQLALDCKHKFIDILSFNEDGDKRFDFRNINFGNIEEPEYYFNCFWQIHTWISVLLDPEFRSIRESSKLSEYIQPIKGAEAVRRFHQLISDGINTLITIEEDFVKINDFLKRNNIKLFLMYDQLDTRINPIYWGKAVSPLIAYWRENYIANSNIIPKIFIRTDLYKRIEGTNKERLKNNIISIEWSIEEVFAYFFKLIFSNSDAAQAFWAISEKTRLHPQHRQGVIKEFANNDNQFVTLHRGQIGPLVDIFFGYRVIVNKTNLGNPWDYFWKELANADNKSISLRPFINMLDGNAVDLALQKTQKYVKQIIPPEIYASREVRLRTATSYFEDLTQDDFSKDLICVKDFINSDKGQEFRYKALSEESFNLLIKFIFNEYHDSGLFKSVRSQDDLKNLLYANGIVAEKVKPGGKIYQFASMYTYVWALKSSELDKDASRGLMDGMIMKGYYNAARKAVCVYGRYYKIKSFMENETVYDGDHVSFCLEIDKNYYQWARDVKLVSAKSETKKDLVGHYNKWINSVVVSENGKEYRYQVKSKKEELYDGAEVVFETEMDPDNPRFLYAINVSIKD